jgi:hypothetical protein
MAMVHGPPAIFDLNGIHDASARFAYVEQNPTYFYRCLLSCAFIAKAVLPDRENSRIYETVKAFEEKHRRLLFG